MTSIETVEKLRFENNRKRVATHFWVALSAWLSRIFSAVAQFVLVRLLLDSIGLDEYAAFAVVTGLAAWFTLADLGIGVSVQNRISEARALKLDSDGIVLLGRVAAIILMLCSIPLAYIASPWASNFLLSSFKTIPTPTLKYLFFIGASGFLVAGISGIVYKIWYAEQRGYLANLIPAGSAFLGLGGVWGATHFPLEQRLLLGTAAFVLPTAILPLGILVYQISKSKFIFLNSITAFQVREVARHAFGFWIFAVMATVTLQIDYVVIPRFLSTSDIAVYTILAKIFGLAFFIYNAMLMALWPVLAEMQMRKEWEAMRKYLRRYILVGIFGVFLFTLCVSLTMPFIFDNLAPGQGLYAPVSLIIFFGVYFAMRVWCDSYGTTLQSMSLMKPFWILVPLQAIICVTLQWILAPRFGLYGVLTGLFLSFLFTVAWGLPYAIRRYTKTSV